MATHIKLWYVYPVEYDIENIEMIIFKRNDNYQNSYL